MADDIPEELKSLTFDDVWFDLVDLPDVRKELQKGVISQEEYDIKASRVQQEIDALKDKMGEKGLSEFTSFIHVWDKKGMPLGITTATRVTPDDPYKKP